jgi:hypothetical protein
LKQNHIKELKYENALWKVLGAIRLIIETTRLSFLLAKKLLTLELTLLLPWNEYTDCLNFEEQLQLMLAHFQVQEMVLKLKLVKFLCHCEGGGLAAVQIKQKGLEWLRSKQLGVLMFGCRNTTALYFEQDN